MQNLSKKILTATIVLITSVAVLLGVTTPSVKANTNNNIDWSNQDTDYQADRDLQSFFGVSTSYFNLAGTLSVEEGNWKYNGKTLEIRDWRYSDNMAHRIEISNVNIDWSNQDTDYQAD